MFVSLAGCETISVIAYLLMGRPGAWIAKKESLSKNTVSALSARFRRKIRTSAAVRQSCFELLYNDGRLVKETYIHLLDGPDKAPPDFFAAVTKCVFNCPSQFSVGLTDWTQFLFTTNRRLLNLRQTQDFLKHNIGETGIAVRTPCQGCRAMEIGTKRVEFYATYRGYLRAHNLGAKHVEEYYLLFWVFYLVHMMAINRMGFGISEDEIHMPSQEAWEQLPAWYAAEKNTILRSLVHYICSFIEDDPL